MLNFRLLFRIGLGIAFGLLTEYAHAGPDIYIKKAKKSEKASIVVWVNESISILKSDEFNSNLLSLENVYPEIWFSQKIGTRSLAQLMFVLAESDPTRLDAKYLKTGIIMKGNSKKDTTRNIGYRGNTFASVGTNSKRKSLPLKMRLGRVHLDRYLTGDTVEKSCAINTMVHEISHTLSVSSSKLESYFLDIPAGLAPEGVPSASYFVGTVAQCTYLQNKGRINKSQFETCVKLFVSQPFPSVRCNDFPTGTVIR